jgi:hypothetical protein
VQNDNLQTGRDSNGSQSEKIRQEDERKKAQEEIPWHDGFGNENDAQGCPEDRALIRKRPAAFLGRLRGSAGEPSRDDVPLDRAFGTVDPTKPLFIQSGRHPDAGQLDQLLPSFGFFGRFSLSQAFTCIGVIFA